MRPVQQALAGVVRRRWRRRRDACGRRLPAGTDLGDAVAGRGRRTPRSRRSRAPRSAVLHGPEPRATGRRRGRRRPPTRSPVSRASHERRGEHVGLARDEHALRRSGARARGRRARAAPRGGRPAATTRAMNASTSRWSSNWSRNSAAVALPVRGPGRLGQGAGDGRPWRGCAGGCAAPGRGSGRGRGASRRIARPATKARNWWRAPRAPRHERARDSTRRIRSEPLIAAAAGGSRRTAVMPSTTSPSERSVTDSSPSEGSTRSMYAV